MTRNSAAKRAKALERAKKKQQRYMDIPPEYYPWEYPPFPQPYFDTEPIINADQYLPWEIDPEHHPCRAYHPADLWEVGMLKKALYNELEGKCFAHVSVVDMPPPPQRKKRKGKGNGKEKEAPGQGRETVRIEDCVHHILCCWNANLKRGESAGPEFLIHFLKRRYKGALSFEDLEGEDERTVGIVTRAAPNFAFHVFLAKITRRAVDVPEVEDEELNSADREPDGVDEEHETPDTKIVEYELDDVVHAGGKEVKLVPRVTKIDLVDEYYFDDEAADNVNKKGVETWIRTVLIIVPTVFVDNFLDYSEVTVHSSDNEESGEEENPIVISDSEDEEAIDADEIYAERESSEEDTEVFECADEEGNVVMIPASVFEEDEPIIQDREEALQHCPKHKKGSGAPAPNQNDRWEVVRMHGHESLVRARYRYLLPHIEAEARMQRLSGYD